VSFIESQDKLAARNAIILAAAQAVCGSVAPITISTAGLVGFYLLGDDKTWATLPAAGFNIGVALGAYPAAKLMQIVGRRLGFMVGAATDMVGALLAMFALFQGSFVLFVVGLVLIGSGGSFVQQYRFAAADQASDKFRPKAISWVLMGGLFAGIIGPQTVIGLVNYFEPVKFAGAYMGAAVLLVVTIIILLFLRFAVPMKRNKDAAPEDTGRPLREIIAQPKFLVALLCGTSSFALMTFVMTGAPLAMQFCGFSVNESTLGIQWHVIAMYGPSFFTGMLIVRFGVLKIIAAGLVILCLSALVALNGITLWHFWLELILLGVGWNFGFIGATTLLTETYRPEEKNKAQGANDMILFSTVALASLFAGTTLNLYGWNMLNMVIFPISTLCFIALIWLARKENMRKAA
jgi:MFS family permease